jgi:hypothetical protein
VPDKSVVKPLTQSQRLVSPSQGKIYKGQIINTFSSQTMAIQDIQSQAELTVPLASWYCFFSERILYKQSKISLPYKKLEPKITISKRTGNEC